MANFFLSLCLLALFLNGSTAQFGPGSSPWQSSRQGAQRQCRLERLSALEPRRRVQSEGGVIEYFDDNNESLNCAGVSAIRETIQPQGLSLPTYFNAHHLIYVVKGRGIAGGVLPGCPESFQSISGQQQQQQGREQQQQEEQGQQQGRERQQEEKGQQQGREQQQQQGREQGQQQGREQQQQEEQDQQQGRERQQEEKGQQQGREQQQQKEQGQGQGRQEQQQRQGRHEQQQQPEEQAQEQQQRQRTSGNQHQRIIRFSQGDILVVPAGMAHWCYNDWDSPVVVVKVLDTSNSANQLNNNPRKFSLAGQTSEQDERSAKNIFRGFNLQFLADALGVSRELTKKLQQGQNGEIIRVQRGLRVVMPPRPDREEQKGRQSKGRQENGLELAFCHVEAQRDIDKPSRADVYNHKPEVKLPQWPEAPHPQLDPDERHKGSPLQGCHSLTPHWNINAHTALYVTGGRGRIQIVGDKGQSVFDQELREGQMVVIPQHFAVVMQAREQQFEWVSFKTHGNAIANQIVGPGSFFRGLPEDVIAQSYRGMTRGEARNLKNQESLLLPGSHRNRNREEELRLE